MVKEIKALGDSIINGYKCEFFNLWSTCEEMRDVGVMMHNLYVQINIEIKKCIIQ